MLEFHIISENDMERIKKALTYSKFRGCEYCFANNFAWRRLADSRITFFEDFYIVCAFDTESGYPEFTYPSGKGDICKVIKEMQAFSEKNNSPLIINSVSEENLGFFKDYYGNSAEITSDEGDFDYIYSREALAELKGKKYHGKRNHIKRFKEMYDYEYREIKESDFDDIYVFSSKLYNDKNGVDVESEIAEQFAINAFLENYERFGLKGGILFADGKMAAYTIGEPITDDTFGVHIEKADTSFHGAYAVINNCFANSIDENYKYLNREEDLGIEGLRKAKRSYKPEFLLKKFTVKVNQ